MVTVIARIALLLSIPGTRTIAPLTSYTNGRRRNRHRAKNCRVAGGDPI
jgi:hypothetical protein